MPNKNRDTISEKMQVLADKGKKPDKRTRDSLKRIRNAYANMLGEGRNPASISVTELAQRANVDRKTFYNYYGSIYELDRTIAAEVGDAFRRSIESNPVSSADVIPHAFFAALADILNRDMDFYGSMFKLRDNSALSRSIIEAVRKEASRTIEEKYGLSGEKLELGLDFVIAGCLEIYRRWYAADPRPPVESVSGTVSVLCFGGLSMLSKDGHYER